MKNIKKFLLISKKCYFHIFYLFYKIREKDIDKIRLENENLRK